MTTASLSAERTGGLNLVRCTFTGAIVLAIQFVLCWAAVFVVPGPTHMFVQIFTAQPMNSLGALFEGLCWSILFGGLTGLLIAIVYNALSPFSRR